MSESGSEGNKSEIIEWQQKVMDYEEVSLTHIGSSFLEKRTSGRLNIEERRPYLEDRDGVRVGHLNF